MARKSKGLMLFKESPNSYNQVTKSLNVVYRVSNRWSRKVAPKSTLVDCNRARIVAWTQKEILDQQRIWNFFHSFVLDLFLFLMTVDILRNSPKTMLSVQEKNIFCLLTIQEIKVTQLIMFILTHGSLSKLAHFRIDPGFLW